MSRIERKRPEDKSITGEIPTVYLGGTFPEDKSDLQQFEEIAMSSVRVDEKAESIALTKKNLETFHEKINALIEPYRLGIYVASERKLSEMNGRRHIKFILKHGYRELNWKFTQKSGLYESSDDDPVFDYALQISTKTKRQEKIETTDEITRFTVSASLDPKKNKKNIRRIKHVYQLSMDFKHDEIQKLTLMIPHRKRNWGGTYENNGRSRYVHGSGSVRKSKYRRRVFCA